MAQKVQIIHITGDELEYHLDEVANRTLEQLRPKIKEINSDLYLMKKWLSVNEASRYTGVPKSTIQKDRRAGLISGKLVGKTYVYTKPELDAYLDSK